MADFWEEILDGAKGFGDYLTNTGSGGALDDASAAFKNQDGTFSGEKIAAGVGGIGSLLGSAGLLGDDNVLTNIFGGGSPQMTGYQGKIPSYDASRMQVPGSYDPNRKAGSSGQRYFTDVDYSGGDTSGSATALQAANLANPARKTASVPTPAPQTFAAGGIAGLNIGGDPRMAQTMAQPRYLSGSMDGMADTIPCLLYTSPSPRD